MRRSFDLRPLEAAGTLASIALWLVLAMRAWRSVESIGAIAIALTALLTVYAAADWLSGLAHWFCDTFFDEDTPVIGAALIQPFRGEHHRDPLAMTRHGFLELNGNNCLARSAPGSRRRFGWDPQRRPACRRLSSPASCSSCSWRLP